MTQALATVRAVAAPAAAAATAVAVVLAWQARCRRLAEAQENARDERGRRFRRVSSVRRRRWDPERPEEMQYTKAPDPFVLEGVPLGVCREKWTADYMAARIGEMRVSVHVSESPGLNFVKKNFSYEMMTFAKFLEKASASSCLGRKTYYYYRSMHEKRKLPSNLDVFGALAEDFSFPDALVKEYHVHSSVLRVATGGMRMWLHYDICDNFLCCIRGRKRVVLIPPRHVLNLYMKESSSHIGSRALESNAKSLEELWSEYPLAQEAWQERWEAILEEGDVLFIPALWLHCTEALPKESKSCEPCVSINTFLLRLDQVDLHDRKDIWANRELLPAQEAFKALTERVLANFQKCPATHRAFYCRKAVAQLLEMVDNADKEEGDEKECPWGASRQEAG